MAKSRRDDPSRLDPPPAETGTPAAGPEPRRVEHVAVLGAGLMGSGIATVSLPLARVSVRDVNAAALERCRAEVTGAVECRMRSGAIAAADRDAMLGRLTLTQRLADLSGADLVIEAVFEDLELKHRVLGEVEPLLSADAVVASNTSALPIGAIARGVRRPERVVGMHYFSPVPKMRLVELVVARHSAPDAVATAHAFAVRQGKNVIVVKDRPGFYTSRILMPLLNEAGILLREGAAVEAVDAAAREFGFPVGPLTLLDALGIDVAVRVLRDMTGRFPHAEPAGEPVLAKLHQAGYAGRKNGRGFYRYDAGTRAGERPVNEAVYALVRSGHGRSAPAEEIADRLALAMANEAARCLHEEVIAGPRDGDLGAVLGLGFPPSRGGPFRYVDSRGAQRVVDRLKALRDAFGMRFEPAPLLGDLARERRRFYASRG